MAKKVQLEVEVKGNDSVGKAAEKTKSLRQELIKLKDELGRGELSGGEFVKAQQRAAELQKTIDDVNKSTKGLSSNNLDAFLDLGQGIAGGFAAAQGAMALFGNENEDLQKKLVKVQSAVAILNGLQGVQKVLAKEGIIVTKITNFLEAQRAAAVATTGTALQAAAVKARMFGIALAATGIGIAIVAIGILAEKFGLFGDSVDETTKKLEESRERLNKYAEQVAELDALSINRKKRETDLAKARLKLNGATNDELIEQDKRLLEYQKVLLEMQVKDRAEGSDEQLKAIDKLEDVKNQIALKEIERQTEIQNRAKKEQEKIDALNEKALAKKRQENDKRIAEEKRVEEEIKKLKQDETEKQRLRGKSDFELELMELQKQAEQKLELVKNDLEAQKLIRDNYQKDADTLNEKYRLQQEEKNKEIKAKKDEQDIADKEAERLRIQELADFDLQTKQNLEDAKIGIANQTAQLLQQVAGKNKSVALTALAIEKGAAIADVIIKGIRERAAITLRYGGNVAAASPELILSKVRTGLSVATIAATGISGAKSISASGGSGGGGSVQPPNIRGSQTTNEQPTPQPTKVFVTETDIRSVTRKVDGIFTQATII